MNESPLRLVKAREEYLPIKDIGRLPSGLRGIYVLYKRKANRQDRAFEFYDVVYVGMSKSGGSGHIKRRLGGHLKRKNGLWTHVSIFEVWDNVRDDEILELEGLFRVIYRFDSRANKLNKQRDFSRMTEVPSIIAG